MLSPLSRVLACVRYPRGLTRVLLAFRPVSFRTRFPRTARSDRTNGEKTIRHHHQHRTTQCPYKVAVRNLSEKGCFALLVVDGQKVRFGRSLPLLSIFRQVVVTAAAGVYPLRAGASSSMMRGTSTTSGSENCGRCAVIAACPSCQVLSPLLDATATEGGFVS